MPALLLVAAGPSLLKQNQAGASERLLLTRVVC
jgi:hypothetical protein